MKFVDKFVNMNTAHDKLQRITFVMRSGKEQIETDVRLSITDVIH